MTSWRVIEVPGILSFLAKGDFTTEVKGVNSLLDQYKADYGTHLPDNPIYGERAGQEIQYVPVMEVTYWGFRMMIGFGGLAALAALVALWVTRKGTVPASRGLMRLAVVRHPGAVRRQRRRLDLHRDGPAAVRRRPQPGPQRHRPGLHVHRRGRLTRRLGRRAADLPGGAHRRLRRAAGGGGQAAGQVHPRRRGRPPCRNSPTPPSTRTRTPPPRAGGPGKPGGDDVLAFAY